MPGQFWGAFLAPSASSFTSDWQPVSKPISILWLTGQMSASGFKSMRKCHMQRLVKALNPTVWLFKCVEVLCRPDSVSHSFSVTICFSPTLSPLSSPLAYTLPSQGSPCWNVLGVSTWTSLYGDWTWYRWTWADGETALSDTLVINSSVSWQTTSDLNQIRCKWGQHELDIHTFIYTSRWATTLCSLI